MSPDPAFGGGVESPQYLALYTYAGNNPVNVTDPTGLVDVPINQAPPGARPGDRFFADSSKKGDWYRSKTPRRSRPRPRVTRSTFTTRYTASIRQRRR